MNTNVRRLPTALTGPAPRSNAPPASRRHPRALREVPGFLDAYRAARKLLPHVPRDVWRSVAESSEVALRYVSAEVLARRVVEVLAAPPKLAPRVSA